MNIKLEECQNLICMSAIYKYIEVTFCFCGCCEYGKKNK